MPADRNVVLDKIAAVRARRDEVRTQVESGAVGYQDIFDLGAVDPAIGTMKLLPLIESIEGVGKVQSRRALAALDLPETVLVESVGRPVAVRLGELLFGETL